MQPLRGASTEWISGNTIRCLVYTDDCLANGCTNLVMLLLEFIDDGFAVGNGAFDGIDLILFFALAKSTSFQCSVQFFQGGLEALNFPC